MSCFLSLAQNARARTFLLLTTDTHTHTHTNTNTRTKILQDPEQEGKKDKGAEQLFKRHHCNKIFPLLWDPPLLIQHQENRSGKKGPVIGPRPGREKESKGKERPISFGEKTENRLSGATVDGGEKNF